MKKLLSFTLLAVGLMAIPRQAHAVWYKGSPKEVFVSSYTTGAVLVTPAISTNAVASAAFAPGVIYQVVLATGASSEFMVMVDTTVCTGITANMVPGNLPANTYGMLGPKLFYASTGTNTTETFDPPIRFDQGLCVVDSAATGQFSVTYELGRGISGQ